MPAKREIPNAHNLVNAYVAGVPHGKILKEAGISDVIFQRLLREAGVKRRTRKEKGLLARGKPLDAIRWKPENLNQLLSDYIDGMSEKAVAEKHGAVRSVIRRILSENGITPRGRSEAETLKWQAIKKDRTLVERQCGAAWKAASSKDDALEETVIAMYKNSLAGAGTISRAVGTSIGNIKRLMRNHQLANNIPERRATGIQNARYRPIASPYEKPILLWLQFLGAEPVYQFAIRPCNVDIAFPKLRVAVEIERRYFSDSKSLRRERMENIFDAGWRVIVVYDPLKIGFDNLAVAQNIIATLDMLRSDESIPGQYGVIGRDGKPYPRSSRHFDGLTRIPRL
jgi:hypothetical protein